MQSDPATKIPYSPGVTQEPFPSDTGASETGLPSPSTKRWVIRRKAAVVDAVRSGILTLEQACDRYKLSTEEFYTWQKLVENYGVPGLRVTRLQSYRAVQERD